MTSPIDAFPESISRRRLLQASSAVTAVALTSGGFRFTAAQTPEVVPSGEAPALADQVNAGDLPPVEERLPTNPKVLEPIEEVGQYGGRIRRAINTAQDANAFSPL